MKETANSGGSLWEHIEALRGTLVSIAICLAVLMAVFFAFMPFLFDNFVLAPTRSDFITYDLLRELTDSSASFDVDLMNINLATPFFLHISLSFWFALAMSMPFILWRLWLFVAPALYDNERGSMRRVFLLSSVFFYLGCALGYLLIFPFTLHFLSNYELSTIVPNHLTLTSYMDNFLMLILLMGLAFQLPLLLMLLNKIKILPVRVLQTHRRHAIVALLILAAVITPTGDPVTMSMVALPLYLLYELSIAMMRETPE